MNTPEDIKRRILENASSDGPKFLEQFKSNTPTDEAYERRLAMEDKGLETPLIAPDEMLLMGAPSLIRAGSKALASDLGRNILANEAGSIGIRKSLPVTKEVLEGVVNKGAKGAVKVIEKGKLVPNSEFAKSTEKAIKGGVKLIDNGKFIPNNQITKSSEAVNALKKIGSSETKFVPKRSQEEYLNKIMNMHDEGKITREQADQYIAAMLNLGVK